jgi:hypothetical protein
MGREPAPASRAAVGDEKISAGSTPEPSLGWIADARQQKGTAVGHRVDQGLTWVRGELS